METARTHIAFIEARAVAAGSLQEVVATLKRRFDRDESDVALVFEVETGRQLDFNLRGTEAEVLAREASVGPSGPGRPRLGVTSREVSLLPRHWDWLEQQPNGISAAMRRLVEDAMKSEPGKQQARRIRAAVSHVLSALAGNRPNFEEASRALFAGDVPGFEALVRRWPKDVREFVVGRARAAAALDRAPQAVGATAPSASHSSTRSAMERASASSSVRTDGSNG